MNRVRDGRQYSGPILFPFNVVAIRICEGSDVARIGRRMDNRDIHD